ncbi:unnamed protein product [Protopolystoma xenopodis]|uniref:Uncharacterized protein n=1 Tax=Protopolystoma xenopodis TaxID=117903 RepID=A0A3S5A956_9PLAT|nr:unnamed protein product [Protopolystoma xenopodis]
MLDSTDCQIECLLSALTTWLVNSPVELSFWRRIVKLGRLCQRHLWFPGLFHSSASLPPTMVRPLTAEQSVTFASVSPSPAATALSASSAPISTSVSSMAPTSAGSTVEPDSPSGIRQGRSLPSCGRLVTTTTGTIANANSSSGLRWRGPHNSSSSCRECSELGLATHSCHPLGVRTRERSSIAFRLPPHLSVCSPSTSASSRRVVPGCLSRITNFLAAGRDNFSFRLRLVTDLEHNFNCTDNHSKKTFTATSKASSVSSSGVESDTQYSNSIGVSLFNSDRLPRVALFLSIHPRLPTLQVGICDASCTIESTQPNPKSYSSRLENQQPGAGKSITDRL